MDGLQRMLELTSFLSERGIHYQIAQSHHDHLLVSSTLVGARLEFDCYNDRIEYRYFAGSEDVLPKEEGLDALIEQPRGQARR